MSCKNQTNIDKYEMDVLSEGLYQMDEASNISIFKNNMYFCSGNTIISVDFNDILNQKMVYKNDSDILALTVNIDGIWIALDNGKIIQCDTDGSILKEYILFEKETNIYNIVVDQGSALLFTEDIIDDYRRTIIYQYDFNEGKLINLSEDLLLGGYFVSGGFLSEEKLYLLYNNIPLSDYSTLIICDSTKILNTYKIKGPIFNGDYNTLRDSLIYSWNGNIYEYNLLEGESSIINVASENFVDKIFITGNNIVSWSDKSIPEEETSIKILIPDDSSLTINYKMSEIVKNYTSKTGNNVEIKFIPKENYLNKIRLRLLEQDSSFDLFFIQDVRENQILNSIINYDLYTPINTLPQLKDFVDDGCIDFVKHALSDKNGNMYGIPLYTAYSVLYLNDGGNKYFGNDKLSFDDIFNFGDSISIDTALFYDINTVYTMFDHLLSLIINQGVTNSSEEIIIQYLTLIKNLNDQNKLYSDKNFLIYEQSLFSVGGVANITKGVVSYPSLNDIDIPSSPVYLGELVNPKTNKSDLVGDFLSFIINEFLYDPHYTNGLIGSDLEKYKTLYGTNQFEDNVDNKSAFENMTILNSYPLLFDYSNFHSEIERILENDFDIEVVAKNITQTLKQWTLE